MIVIEVYFIDVTAADDVVEALADLLADGELVHANRYRFADDRCRSIVARAAVRRLLGRYLDADPRTLTITAGEHGKPALPGREIEFNVSHSGDLVAIAFAKGAPIGIDVERRRRLNDARALARRFFSAEEHAMVTAAADLEAAFLTVWTAKEAIVKATGKGIGASDLRGFTVPFGDRRMLPVFDGWSVAAIDPPLKNYFAAVAAQEEEEHDVISNIVAPASLI